MLARSRDWLMAFIWYHNDQLIELYNLCGFGAFLLKNDLVMAIFVSEPRFHAEKWRPSLKSPLRRPVRDTKVPPNFFVLSKVLLTHWDGWIDSSLKFPRDYTGCRTISFEMSHSSVDRNTFLIYQFLINL